MPKNSGKQQNPNPNPSSSLSLRERLDGNELDLSLSGLSEVPARELAALPKATNLDMSCNCIIMLPWFNLLSIPESRHDVEMPALDWGEHNKKSYNTRLKSNRFVSMSLAFGALLLPQVNEEPEFCNLTHLIKLDLSKNQLQELPSDFGRLVNLQHLDLYNNKLTNLPVSFAQLKNLKWLDLKGNPLDPLLEKVAGDCLDEKQCKLSAANVLRYMKTIQSEQDREKQRRLQVERELEKRRESEMRAKEARERELRKREKMEEKERRRKEYDAQKLQRFNQPKEEKPIGTLEKPAFSSSPSSSQKGHLFRQVLLKVLLFLLLGTVITVVMCRRTDFPHEQLCSAVNHLYEDTLHALRGNEILQRILRSIPFP